MYKEQKYLSLVDNNLVSKWTDECKIGFENDVDKDITGIKERLQNFKKMNYEGKLEDLFIDYCFGMSSYHQSVLKELDFNEIRKNELKRFEEKLINKSYEELLNMSSTIKLLIKEEVDNLIDIPYYQFDIEVCIKNIDKLNQRLEVVKKIIRLKRMNINIDCDDCEIGEILKFVPKNFFHRFESMFEMAGINSLYDYLSYLYDELLAIHGFRPEYFLLMYEAINHYKETRSNKNNEK